MDLPFLTQKKKKGLIIVLGLSFTKPWADIQNYMFFFLQGVIVENLNLSGNAHDKSSCDAS